VFVKPAAAIAMAQIVGVVVLKCLLVHRVITPVRGSND
jgi:hypothetical protein